MYIYIGCSLWLCTVFYTVFIKDTIYCLEHNMGSCFILINNCFRKIIISSFCMHALLFYEHCQRITVYNSVFFLDKHSLLLHVYFH